jgi:hypothetical protein
METHFVPVSCLHCGTKQLIMALQIDVEHVEIANFHYHASSGDDPIAKSLLPKLAIAAATAKRGRDPQASDAKEDPRPKKKGRQTIPREQQKAPYSGGWCVDCNKEVSGRKKHSEAESFKGHKTLKWKEYDTQQALLAAAKSGIVPSEEKKA